MPIADRLRDLREAKDLSQGDIEKRTGLLRCYISRVENGHTVPAVETLEKFARALEVSLYQLFYSGDERANTAALSTSNDDNAYSGRSRSEVRFFRRFRELLSQMGKRDRDLLLLVANRMAHRGKRGR